MPDQFKFACYGLAKRWSLCQALVQHWWKRWLSEYLQQLQRLHKWRKSTGDIQPDDIVKEDNMVTNHWPALARVVSTFLGHDGKSRVVFVRTKMGIYKRPITNNEYSNIKSKRNSTRNNSTNAQDETNKYLVIPLIKGISEKIEHVCRSLNIKTVFTSTPTSRNI